MLDSGSTLDQAMRNLLTGDRFPSRRTSSHRQLAWLASCLLACLPSLAVAQTTYDWSGGDGTWAVGTSGWDQGNWAAGNNAVFAGTPGTVTVNAGIAPASTTIDVAGYTFTPGAGLVDWRPSSVVINADTTFVGGTDLQIVGENWSGSGNVTISGGTGRRTVLLGSGTTWTGDLEITSGSRFQSGYGVSLNSTTVNNDGGILILAGGNLSIDGLTGNGAVEPNGNRTLTVGAGNASTTFSGVFRNGTLASGVLSVNKTGTGTLTLSGANTSTGTVTISGGTLQIGDGGSTGTLGSGSVSVGTGATLGFNRSGDLAVANAISGNGSLVQSGPGAVSLSGTNSYAGGTSVTAGILSFSSQASLPGWGDPGAVTVAAGGALAVGNDTSPEDAVTAGYVDSASGLGFDTSAGDRTWATAITGTRPFVKTGANTLTLTAVNTYDSPTTIAAGTLELQSDSDQTLAGAFSGGGAVRKSGAGTLTLSGAAAYTGATTIDAGTIAFAASANQTLSGTLSGSGAIVKSGAGSLSFPTATGFTGAATVVAGTLQLGGAATPSGITLGTADTGSDNVQITLGSNTDRAGFTAPITVSNQGAGTATIKWIETGTTSGSGNGLIMLERATTFDATQFAGGFFQVNHALSGTGDIALTGTNGTRFLLEADSPNYTGDITVQSGGIFEPRNRLTATSGNDLTIESGGRGFFFGTATIGGLNGGGTVERSPAGNGTISVGKGDASGSFSGSITTGVALVKTGTGTQVLSGSSSTSSTTTVNGGTLRLDTGAALASSTVSLANAAGVTLENNGAAVTIGGLTGGGATGGSVVLTSGTLTVSKASGTDTFAGVVSGAGNLTKSGAAVLVLSGSNTYSGATLITAGGLRATDGVGLPTASLLTLDGNAATLQTSGTFNRQMGSASGQVRLTGAGSDGVGFSAVGGPLVVDLQQNGGGGTATWSIGGNPNANQVNISNLLLNDASATNAIEFRNNWNFGGGTRRIRVNATAAGTAATASGVLSNGNFEKTGAGTLVLSGNNTHGNTRIVGGGGTLEAASNTALGTGTVTVDAGTTLRLANYATVANTITAAGTVSFAGGGVRWNSPESLASVAGLMAGTAATPVTQGGSFNPTFAWTPQIAGTTYSDVLDLTNTAGTIQILELSYDPSTLGSLAPADLFLGWDNSGAWVNAIAGNSGSAGGSAVFNQTGSLSSLGILPTADYLGSWGRDTATNTAWAVIDHNSDFAVIAVPEPATVALLGVAAGLGLTGFRRRRRPEVH